MENLRRSLNELDPSTLNAHQINQINLSWKNFIAKYPYSVDETKTIKNNIHKIQIKKIPMEHLGTMKHQFFIKYLKTRNLMISANGVDDTVLKNLELLLKLPFSQVDDVEFLYSIATNFFEGVDIEYKKTHRQQIFEHI